VRRQLFTSFSGLSLLVCMAVCVLWVRSYRYVSYHDTHRYSNDSRRCYRVESWAVSYDGQLCYAHSNLWSDDPLAMQLIAKPDVHGTSFDAVARPAWDSRQASTGFLARTFAGFGYRSESRSWAGDLKMTGPITRPRYRTGRLRH
jgi:hypothetical protein